MESHSDHYVLETLGRQLARHRIDRNQTQSQLAKEAGVSLRTVIRLESGSSTQLTNLIRVLRALDLLPNLQKLVPQPLASPLAKLRADKKERKRASSRSAVARETPPKGNWTWGDSDDAPRAGDR
ncbi:MAG: helix-turn-helix transcriptional regulator [Planctomycetes bacterium]|nr:helix-turn-helix transcriptional regulator [Planctomycetota bacterium]